VSGSQPSETPKPQDEPQTFGQTNPSQDSSPAASRRWQTRPLGTTGRQVTPLGLGGAWLGRTEEGLDKDLGVATVLRALDLGLNLIDTSASYLGGRSEAIIGQALRIWQQQGGRREDLVISTKTGTRNRRDRDYTAPGTIRSVETSLELLGLDTLDVVLVHDPSDLEPVLAPGGAWEALKSLKAEGIVRAIGLGVRNHAFHRRVIATGACDVVLTYRDYNLLHQTALDGVLEPAAGRNVAVLNGMTLVSGLLTGRHPREVVESKAHHAGDEDEIHRAEMLWRWARERDVNLLALNLQFCMRQSRIAATLVGASTPEQIEADVAAAQAEIPDEVWDALPHQLPGFTAQDG
jgi:aryl-alcohol dehydrogenase-like predicted oxidoreductase